MGPIRQAPWFDHEVHFKGRHENEYRKPTAPLYAALQAFRRSAYPT